jgi:hypothetical protein
MKLDYTALTLGLVALVVLPPQVLCGMSVFSHNGILIGLLNVCRCDDVEHQGTA